MIWYIHQKGVACMNHVYGFVNTMLWKENPDRNEVARLLLQLKHWQQESLFLCILWYVLWCQGCFIYERNVPYRKNIYKLSEEGCFVSDIQKGERRWQICTKKEKNRWFLPRQNTTCFYAFGVYSAVWAICSKKVPPFPRNFQHIVSQHPVKRSTPANGTGGG